jgi:hypothetical protein
VPSCAGSKVQSCWSRCLVQYVAAWGPCGIDAWCCLPFRAAQDPLAIIGLVAIFLPFLLTLLAIATGLVELPGQ